MQATMKSNDFQENENNYSEVNIVIPANQKSNNLIDLSTQPLQSHIYKEIINFIYNVSEIYLTEDQIEDILVKNSALRFEILKNNTIENVYISDGILSAIAFYFLGRDWPDIKDHTSQSSFVYQLNKKAEKWVIKSQKLSNLY